MQVLSPTEKAEKTRHQIELVDVQLTREFSMLPAALVHREVAEVSQHLLAEANFTDHVAVLTGRFAAEHLRAGADALGYARERG
ncbi:MAG: three-helix bundle dimerization domain-containing protein [Gaiellaceae bacterium]